VYLLLITSSEKTQPYWRLSREASQSSIEFLSLQVVLKGGGAVISTFRILRGKRGMEGAEERRENYCVQGFVRTNVCGSWCDISEVNLCSTLHGFIIVCCVGISKTPRNSVQCSKLHDVNICKTVMSSAGIELALVLYVSMLCKKGNFSYESNIDARSRNHYCSGKTISIKLSVCFYSFTYPAFKTHAPYYVDVCGLAGSTAFFHIVS